MNHLYQTFQSRHAQNLKWLMASFAFVLIAAVAIVGFYSVKEYDASNQKGKADATRLAAILADHVEQNLHTVDLFLQQAVERQRLNLLFGGTLPNDIINHFKLWVDSRPNMVALMIINQKGETEVAVNNKLYSKWIDYDKSFKDFLPFIYLRKDESDLQLLMPYKTKDNKEILLVARRMSKLDGTFGGIVIAAIDSDCFLDFFASVDSNHERVADVVMSDGKSLFGEMNHSRLWKIKRESLNKLWKSTQQTTKTNDSITIKTNGRLNIVAYQKVINQPLTAMVAIDEGEFLYQFWQDRFKDLGFLALILLFVSVGAFFILTMSKQMMRVKKSEAAAILASQTKSEFLANMSHELRTPLNAIIGFSEMLNAGYFGPLNTKQKDRMGDITLCGNHLLQLINDILEFSKGEAGRLEIVEEKVNVFDAVNETARIMNEKIKSKSLQFKIDVPENLPRLFADKRKLKQVLINLISNSVKFTPPNGLVTVKAHMDGNRNMIIEVIDTGIGIAEEDIQIALDVFGQVHRSQSHEGTGLGLPLCRMFTELHNGRLTLISSLGEGTTVRLQFPEVRVIEHVLPEPIMVQNDNFVA